MTAVRPARRYFVLSAIALALTFAEAASASVRVPLSGWNWGNPTPQGNDLRAIDFIGAAWLRGRQRGHRAAHR